MTSKYIEDTFAELEAQVSGIESDMDSLVSDYLSDFAIDDTTLKNISDNYSLANKSDRVFDDAYKTFIAAFLIFLGKKIIDGVTMTIADFSSKGIKPVGNEVKLAGKMIGFVEGKIVKGGYLDQLGRMGVLRQKFHDYIIKSVSTGQKFNLFMRNVHPLFKSGDKESMLASYYRRYAYDSVAQVMNIVALYIADERGLTHFLYEGGLVKDSRPFCRAHAGGIYTRTDAKRFDGIYWKGKIPDLPFLVAVGGYNCMHSINWLANE